VSVGLKSAFVMIQKGLAVFRKYDGYDVEAERCAGDVVLLEKMPCGGAEKVLFSKVNRASYRAKALTSSGFYLCKNDLPIPGTSDEINFIFTVAVVACNK